MTKEPPRPGRTNGAWCRRFSLGVLVGIGLGCGRDSGDDRIDESISRDPEVFLPQAGQAPVDTGDTERVADSSDRASSAAPQHNDMQPSDPSVADQQVHGIDLGEAIPHRYFSARQGKRFISGRVDCPDCTGQVRLVASTDPEIGANVEDLVGAVTMDPPWEFELTEMPDDKPLYLQACWDPTGTVRPDTLFVGSRISETVVTPADSNDVFGIVVSLPESLAITFEEAASFGPSAVEEAPESSSQSRYYSANLGNRRVSGTIECDGCQGEVLIFALGRPEDPPPEDSFLALSVVAEPTEFVLDGLPTDNPIYLRGRWDSTGQIRPGTPGEGARVSEFVVVEAGEGDVDAVHLTLVPMTLPTPAEDPSMQNGDASSLVDARAGDLIGDGMNQPFDVASSGSEGRPLPGPTNLAVSSAENMPSDGSRQSRKYSAELGSRRVGGTIACEGCEGEVLVFALAEQVDPPPSDSFLALVVVAEPSEFVLEGLPADVPIYLRGRWDPAGKIASGPPEEGARVSGFVVIDAGEADVDTAQLVLLPADFSVRREEPLTPDLQTQPIGAPDEAQEEPVKGNVLSGRVRCDWCSGEVLVTVSDTADLDPEQVTFLGVDVVNPPWEFEFSGLPENGTVHVRARWDVGGQIQRGVPGMDSRVTDFISMDLATLDPDGVEIVLGEDQTVSRFALPDPE